jgi:hypothetical protein
LTAEVAELALSCPGGIERILPLTRVKPKKIVPLRRQRFGIVFYLAKVGKIPKQSVSLKSNSSEHQRAVVQQTLTLIV